MKPHDPLSSLYLQHQFFMERARTAEKLATRIEAIKKAGTTRQHDRKGPNPVPLGYSEESSMSNINVNLHLSMRPGDFGPIVNCFPDREGLVAFALTIDKDHSVSTFLSHEQLITLRDTLTEAIANSPVKCAHSSDCEEIATRTCEACENRYCEDHCTKGGDVEGGTNPNGSPHGAYAVPANCDKCRERAA